MLLAAGATVQSKSLAFCNQMNSSFQASQGHLDSSWDKLQVAQAKALSHIALRWSLVESAVWLNVFWHLVFTYGWCLPASSSQRMWQVFVFPASLHKLNNRFFYGSYLTIQHLSGQDITKKKTQRRKWNKLIWEEILVSLTVYSSWQDFNMTLSRKSSDLVKIIKGFFSHSLMFSHPQPASWQCGI